VKNPLDNRSSLQGYSEILRIDNPIPELCSCSSSVSSRCGEAGLGDLPSLRSFSSASDWREADLDAGLGDVTACVSTEKHAKLKYS
jgi:hypothetical protein